MEELWNCSRRLKEGLCLLVAVKKQYWLAAINRNDWQQKVAPAAWSCDTVKTRPSTYSYPQTPLYLITEVPFSQIVPSRPIAQPNQLERAILAFSSLPTTVGRTTTSRTFLRTARRSRAGAISLAVVLSCRLSVLLVLVVIAYPSVYPEPEL